MAEGHGDSHRRRFWLRLKATLASLYFAAMFFVLGPAALLFLTRENPWQVAGPLLAIPGAVLIIGANLWVTRLVSAFIREGDGTHVPLDPPRHFVRSHSYQRLRNPMYLAYVLIMLGEALLFGSPVLVLYAFGFWLIAHAYVVSREEPLLQRRFGDDYEHYKARVPRWGIGMRRGPPADS